MCGIHGYKTSWLTKTSKQANGSTEYAWHDLNTPTPYPDHHLMLGQILMNTVPSSGKTGYVTKAPAVSKYAFASCKRAPYLQLKFPVQ